MVMLDALLGAILLILEKSREVISKGAVARVILPVIVRWLYVQT
jgi:hypothetical protein